MLSVIVPTLNAEATLQETLKTLAGATDAISEIVVVDGGSVDHSVDIASRLGARVIQAPRGRGGQLAAGAAASRNDWLLFLHADTRLSDHWQSEVATFMAAPANKQRAAFFRFALDDAAPAARRLERMVAWRCRFFGLPYGDQGLLIARDFFVGLGGFRALPLMEDVDLVRRIGKRRLAMFESRAITSAARYRNGYLRRSLRNLSCLALYFMGMPTPMIAKLYG